MKRVLISLLLVLLLCPGCSRKSTGGDGDGDGMGDSNIPIAEPGSELRDVFFDYDSSALSFATQSALRENARWLIDNPNVAVIVEGHCDERGTAEYNMALGQRRGQTVADFLRTIGVQGSRMSVTSYGKEVPLDPGHNDRAWAKNRRVHFSAKK